MRQDAEAFDSLSRAMVELREEIILWIDTALARLREREQQESLAMVDESAPVTLTRSGMERGSESHAPGPAPGPKSESPAVDSLKRLDALARLLDQRLKVSQEPTSNNSGASGEVGESND